MCEHCNNAFTRRGFLAAVGAASLAALGACETDPRESAVVPQLPDPALEEVPHDPAPHIIDETKIVVPPTPPRSQWIDSDVGLILPRSAWTKSPPDMKRVQPMDGVKLITIHHSGDGKPFLGESIPDIARHLEGVRQWHIHPVVDHRHPHGGGMCDIAYHFAVDRAGRVWQLRSMQYRGQHVRIGANGKVWNEHNMGIVVLGDFNLQSLTEAQKAKLLAFVPYARKKYALPAAAVHLHGELVETDCPGKHLQTVILQARKQNAL